MIDFKTKATPNAYRNPTKNEKLVRQPKSKPPRISSLEGKNSDLLKSSWRAQEGVHSLKLGVKMSSVDQGKEIESEDLEGQEKENADPRQRVGILGYQNARGADVDAAEFTDVHYSKVMWRISQAMADERVRSGSLVNVLIALAISMHGDDEVGITQQDMADLARVSKRTVWLRVADAVELGYVSVDTKADKNQGTGANVYRATSDWIPQQH